MREIKAEAEGDAELASACAPGAAGEIRKRKVAGFLFGYMGAGKH
ncbi:hypothetical protein [Rhodopseudomonas sp.]|nr:hypothetical protein [Rhodopseudomonas sp.]